jgi:NADPH:quinone reductase-like Zn-dependent oxidoreductase
LIVQALTAYYSIVELGRSRKGQVILIHSIAGGVGLFAVDIAQKLGMHVIGTIGSPSKKKYLSDQFGIPEECVIVRENPKDFAHQVENALKKINKTGVDLVLDSLSGDYFMPSFNLTNKGGKYIIFGSGTLMPGGSLGSNVLFFFLSFFIFYFSFFFFSFFFFFN